MAARHNHCIGFVDRQRNDRGKPEPQAVWGSLLHQRYRDEDDLPSAQKANLHYLLALELSPRNPRWRSTLSLGLMRLVQAQSAA